MTEPAVTQLVLALDGGGSKSHFALADRHGRVERSGLGMGVNALDNPAWRANLGALLAPLRGRGEIAMAVFGMPGFGESRLIDAEYRAALAELHEGPHVVRNDVEMAFDGAFLDRPGVLALSGTGAMAVARGDSGRLVRAGGWGDGFGDEGSAYWIGRRALQHASWAADGRLEAPEFLAGLCRAMGLRQGPPFFGLMDWYAGLTHPRSEIARLAMLVDALAETGDAIADDILAAAAGEVARQTRAAAEAAGLCDPLAWSAGGSVFASRSFREHLARQLQTEARPAALPPLGGGLWLAAQRAGWSIDQHWLDRIGQSLDATAPQHSGGDFR
jgi:glucosamine kinase